MNVYSNDIENLLEYIQELTELQLKRELFAFCSNLTYQVKEYTDQIKRNNSIFSGTYISFYILQRDRHGFNKRIGILHKCFYLRQFYRGGAVNDQISEQLVNFVVMLQGQYSLKGRLLFTLE